MVSNKCREKFEKEREMVIGVWEMSDVRFASETFIKIWKYYVFFFTLKSYMSETVV